MKDVQCYELFGGIALKNHAFSFYIFTVIIIVPNMRSHTTITSLFVIAFAFKNMITADYIYIYQTISI